MHEKLQLNNIRVTVTFLKANIFCSVSVGITISLIRQYYYKNKFSSGSTFIFISFQKLNLVEVYLYPWLFDATEYVDFVQLSYFIVNFPYRYCLETKKAIKSRN